MQRILLLASAGLSLSLFVGLALAGVLAPTKRGAARSIARRYLALVPLQAALYFLKDIAEQSFGWVRLATFIIYADFLFGMPAMSLFLREIFDERDERPIRHFFPALVNVVPAIAMAALGVGSNGIDGVVERWPLSVPWLYIHLLAAGETLQLVLYSRSSLKLLRRHGTARGAREYRGMARITICGYAGYYAVRWVGLVVRIKQARGTTLLPSPPGSLPCRPTFSILPC